jgi:hypothetical protein
MRWRTVRRMAATAVVGLLVPGAVAADGLSLPERLTPVYLHHQPGFAFDAALSDIARTRDVATVRWVAKSLQYPTTNPRLSGPAWPWTLTLRPILIGAAAIAAFLSIQLLSRRRRGTAHAAGERAAGHRDVAPPQRVPMEQKT